MSGTGNHQTDARPRRTALVLVGVAAGMLGLSYAAVPLYQLFCQVTGYGGTTQRADAPEGPVAQVPITVLFDANTAKDLAWDFRPVQRALTVRPGEEALAFYTASNTGTAPLVGTATFNVAPAAAGRFFNKIECFCFTEQRLEPGESVDMPVSFFVDAAMLDDPLLAGVREITLSYTFFRAESGEDETAKAAEPVDTNGAIN